MKKRKVYAFTVLVGASLILSSCGSKSSVSGEMAVAQTAAAAPMEENAEYQADYENGSDLKTETEAPAAATVEGGGLTAASGPLDATALSRKLIRTVDLSAETTEFDKLVIQLSGKISQLGGYVENSQINGTRIYNDEEATAKYAVITARVPADKLDQLVTVVEENSNVIAKSENTSDVTLQYADLESRKKSLQIEQERLWALLEKAEDLDVILRLESRLTEIRYSLESMESQLKLYDNQVTYSTVHLNIEEVIKLTAEPKTPSTGAMDRMKTGFAKNLVIVSNTFVNLMVGIVAGLPYLIVLAVICAVGFARYRVYRKRQADKSQKAAEDPSHKTEE